MSYSLIPAQPLASQADSDSQMIALWLHGKSQHTQQAYTTDAQRFFAVIQKPLQQITLQDLQDYADTLGDLSNNSRKRAINSVKSLFTFGHKLGYLPFNVAAALKAPSVKNTLAERMLSESEVLTMIALTKKERDKLLLRLLYASAGHLFPYRVSADGRVFALAAEAYPLGVRDRLDIISRVAKLEAGDSLVLYSDGIVEARREGGEEEFGFERLERSLGVHAGKSPGQLRDGILADVEAFTRSAPREDDVTLLVLRMP